MASNDLKNARVFLGPFWVLLKIAINHSKLPLNDSKMTVIWLKSFSWPFGPSFCEIQWLIDLRLFLKMGKRSGSYQVWWSWAGENFLHTKLPLLLGNLHLIDVSSSINLMKLLSLINFLLFKSDSKKWILNDSRYNFVAFFYGNLTKFIDFWPFQNCPHFDRARKTKL